MNKGFNDLWPTTIYLDSVDKSINDELCEKILLETNFIELQENFQRIDILKEDWEIVKRFKNEVVWPTFIKYLERIDIDIESFPERKVRSWLAGTYSGYNISIHNHSCASFSAVFYLLCEEQNRGGELVFMDSRINANRGYEDQFKKIFQNEIFLPKTTDCVVFPSFVYHHTTPFRGNIRLAMPVDLYL